MLKVPLLLTHIRQLLTLCGPAGPRRGRALSELGIIEDAAVLCVGGKIVSAGSLGQAARDPWLKNFKTRVREMDCRGKVVLPGFVDSHTHPVFAAPRLNDFEKRIAGATYEEIAKSGGGIVSSMAGVRRATRAALAKNVLHAFRQMAAQGTTTVEAKSGYGLSLAAELKSLAAIRDAARRWPGTVVPTLLGAHVVPPEFGKRRGEYVQLVSERMIPQVASRHWADFVDVYCERGAFSLAEARQIFASAERHGLGIRVHVCQLSAANISALLQDGSVSVPAGSREQRRASRPPGLPPRTAALRFQPASLDHLDCIQDEDIPLLAKSNTIATLMPGSNYFLGLEKYPPARKLIEAGVAVALASDYNPGTSPTPSMPFVLSLACTQMKMLPAEAIAAATINGAHALRLAHRKGSIEPGKDADLAVFDAEDYREIPYWFGTNRCDAVVLNGHLAT
ncbi:MAG: amidohydrolase family protein [Terriglobales bacterium]